MQSFVIARQLLLLVTVLASVPATAQSRVADLCKSGLCSSHGKQLNVGLAQPAGIDLRPGRSSPDQDWKQHMQERPGEEAYNCALSMTVGGELKLDGYIGARLLGRSMTLKRPGAQVAR